MKIFISLAMLAALVLSPPLARAQQTLTADAEITAFRQLAEKIPLGSRIKLQTREGRRLTATLMAVSADGIVVKRESRLPEPAVSVGYSELTRLHLDEKSGFSLGKAVGIGLAAGVGAILTLFAIAVSIND